MPTSLDRTALLASREELTRRLDAFRARGLALDMSRGNPSPEQLALSEPLLELVKPGDVRSPSGVDCRNYGVLEGLPELREMFAPVVGADPSEVWIGGNSSLALMHDLVCWAMLLGAGRDSPPWARSGSVRFLCPSPGYDRHFNICARLGIEMIRVDLTADGPDMDQVETLVAADASIRGIWCVPRYSNPTGIVYSDEVVERLAAMPTAAPDFRLFWDNAYAVHHLVDRPRPLRNVLEACKAAGHPDRPYVFASTSKITFAGGGVSCLATSTANLAHLRQSFFVQTIGQDKLNQLRHLRFLRDAAGIESLMRRHAALLRPKFAAVQEVLERELGALGIASWSRPEGGYFVSLETPDGCAKRVVQLAAEAGVKLTPAGAPFPHGIDPRDRVLRLAPSFPSKADIELAMELVSVCVRLASVERELGAAT